MELRFHPSWKPLFETHATLLQSIEEKIQESSQGNIYPPKEQRYRVFEKDLHQIQIVLLGQDPYHGKGEANGLSFSTYAKKISPSLLNIYKEIQNNFPERNYTFQHGDLTHWFQKEHIFLLNASLSVEEKRPGSHLSYWEPFTNKVIEYIASQHPTCIFLLFGNYAISKAKWIQDKSRILSTSHPSPLGAYRGFLGSGIFSKCEELLGRNIRWMDSTIQEESKQL
jgi:uracil-DNA glycosylase